MSYLKNEANNRDNAQLNNHSMTNRRKITFVSVLLLSILSLFSINKLSAQNYGHVSLDVFYDELSPYGNWDYDSNYGDIWFPAVGRDFRPYSTNGYWTMTQYGNTWVSNYAWGWAPFHYGRWVHTPHHGWGWTPGYEWGPAWVDWRSGNGYYGWAPMPPRGGINVNISIGLPIDLWIFTPSRRIYDRHVYRYSHYGRNNIYNKTTIINNTYIVNNNHYYGGPSRRDVERSTGRRVSVRDITNSNKPGATRVDSRSVSMYRPDGRTNSNGTRSENRPTRNISTTENNRSSNNNRNESRISREMHISKDGNTVIRERNNSKTTKDNKIENSRQERVISRTENNRVNQRTPINNNSNQNRERGNVGRIENSRPSRSQQQPKIQQRQATPKIERNRNTDIQMVRQDNRSNGNLSRQSTPRVERNTSSSNRSNVSTRNSTSTNARSNSSSRISNR